MTTQTSPVIEHRIGAQGAVTLSVPAGGVTIQGVDGDIVRLSSPTGRDLHEDYRIETADGLIELRPRDMCPQLRHLLAAALRPDPCGGPARRRRATAHGERRGPR